MEDNQVIRQVEILKLKPHPKNIEIYGDENVDDLIESIKKFGVLDSLIITDKNYIISGHRRYKACKMLGFKKIGAIIKHYDTEEDEIEELVNLNITRERTLEQKAREASTLLEVEKKKAEIRRILTQNNISAKEKAEVANLPPQIEQGKTRDIVAEKVGFKSGREAERAIKTVKKIDELKEKGDNCSLEKAEILKGVLNNRNASAAENLADVIEEIDFKSDEKEKIKSGTVSPNSYVEKAKEMQKSPEKKVCKTCGKELPDYYFYKGKNSCVDCINERTRQTREPSYMKSASGYKYVIDEEKIKNIDFDAIERSIKDEDLSRTVIIDPKAECMEFQACIRSFLLQHSKYIENELIINKMQYETRQLFLNSISDLEELLQQIKLKLMEDK